MNKLILISALLVATLSAVYASPYSSQERLLSLLENARQEQADEQDEIARIVLKNKGKKQLKKIRRQQIERICAHATLVYNICSDDVEEAPEEVPEEPVMVQGRCKKHCNLKQKIREGEIMEAALNMFVNDAEPILCVYHEAIQQLCGVPEPV